MLWSGGPVQLLSQTIPIPRSPDSDNKHFHNTNTTLNSITNKPNNNKKHFHNINTTLNSITKKSNNNNKNFHITNTEHINNKIAFKQVPSIVVIFRELSTPNL